MRPAAFAIPTSHHMDRTMLFSWKPFTLYIQSWRCRESWYLKLDNVNSYITHTHKAQGHDPGKYLNLNWMYCTIHISIWISYEPQVSAAFPGLCIDNLRLLTNETSLDHLALHSRCPLIAWTLEWHQSLPPPAISDQL
jgi:hypothetical protein